MKISIPKQRGKSPGPPRLRLCETKFDPERREILESVVELLERDDPWITSRLEHLITMWKKAVQLRRKGVTVKFAYAKNMKTYLIVEGARESRE